MKKLLLTIFAALFAVTLFAGDAPSGWTTDIDAALARAKRENKYVLILFTGSDWCGWCVELKNKVLSKKRFKDLAKDNFVLVYFDFPRRNPPKDEQMRIQRQWQQRFSVRGYPGVVIVNPDGEKVGQISGFRDLDAYVSELEKYLPQRRSSSRGNRRRQRR